jgi:hypothetical protein
MARAVATFPAARARTGQRARCSGLGEDWAGAEDARPAVLRLLALWRAFSMEPSPRRVPVLQRLGGALGKKRRTMKERSFCWPQISRLS